MGNGKNLFKKYRRVLTLIGRGFSIVFSIILVVFCNMFQSIHEENFNLIISIQKSFEDPIFWLLIVAINLAWVVIYMNFYTIAKEKKLSEPSSQEIINEFTILNKRRPKNFNEFVKVENLRRKKESYVDMMNDKLAEVQIKLEKFPLEKMNTEKYRLLKEQEQDIINKLDDKYIEENLFTLTTKYNRVRMDDFRLCFTNAKTSDKTTSEEDKKLAKTISARMILGILSSTLMVGVTASLSGLFSFKDEGFWITITMVIVTCFIQIYFGSSNADKLTDSEILAPTVVKSEIIRESLVWDNADKKDDDLQRALDKYIQDSLPKEPEAPKKAVITQAELEYLQKHKEEISKEIEEEINNQFKEEEQDGNNTKEKAN